MDDDVTSRAAVHAALGEPVRLAIVDELALSDRAPSDLAVRFGLAGNLVAHHLDVLERVGLVERIVSSGDRRRRYVRLRPDHLPVRAGRAPRRRGRALFVCTHNSARSQLAAVLWQARTGDAASSAGTKPAAAVHPGAVAAAARAGLDLTGARPRALDTRDLTADLVVTVCDVAHEALAHEVLAHEVLARLRRVARPPCRLAPLVDPRPRGRRLPAGVRRRPCPARPARHGHRRGAPRQHGVNR